MNRPRGIVCFSHGKESGPDGLKIRHLRPIAEAAGYADKVIHLDKGKLGRIEDNRASVGEA